MRLSRVLARFLSEVLKLSPSWIGSVCSDCFPLSWLELIISSSALSLSYLSLLLFAQRRGPQKNHHNNRGPGSRLAVQFHCTPSHDFSSPLPFKKKNKVLCVHGEELHPSYFPLLSSAHHLCFGFFFLFVYLNQIRLVWKSHFITLLSFVLGLYYNSHLGSCDPYDSHDNEVAQWLSKLSVLQPH